MEINSPPIVRLEGLRMSFGANEVLKGIDLEVPAGRVLGYLGPNGAGKSTTVRILIGMLTGFRGTVRVCGFDVAKDPLEVKRRIGYVPEAGALYEALTPLEYLSLVGGLHGLGEKELITSLAKVGKTVFYCSHLMDVVERVCDRITIIDGGKIVADGTFEELKVKVADASLERIFTQLTRKDGQDGVAADFLRVIQG